MDETDRLIPEFGPLAGMRVLCTGSLIAAPFAASMLADFGAEVIEIERPGRGDTYRAFPPVAKNGTRAASASWIQEARNRLSMTLELDLAVPEVREIFYGLIRDTDVYLENMVWLDKLGIRDEVLLEINPRLVITHVSGYGRARFGGVPEICDQASYDMIGQAFSGYLLHNGDPDRPPVVARPSLNDYVTAMFALFGVLAACQSAHRTGRGQVVDVAQFEAQARLMRDTFTASALGLEEVHRHGNGAEGFQPWDLFLSADNEYVALGAYGPAVFGRFMEAAGFDPARYPYDRVAKDRQAVASPLGRELAGRVTDWCRVRTAQEIETRMRACRVPCSRVNTARACMENDQYRLRDDFITYEDRTLGQTVTAFGVVPKMSGTPGRVWRGAPALGEDTERILKTRLGYGEEKIAALRAGGLI